MAGYGGDKREGDKGGVSQGKIAGSEFAAQRQEAERGAPADPKVLMTGSSTANTHQMMTWA